MTGRELVAAFAAAAGLDPLDDAEIDALLDLAGRAAHASERIAAPLVCHLAGRAGLDAAAAALVLERAIAADRDDPEED